MPKIRHIAISTENPEETAAWYKEVFGLEEVGKSPVGVYLSDGEINFAILRLTEPGDPNRVIKGLHHFGFMAEDPQAIYQKLDAKGTKRLPDVALGGAYFEVKYEGPDGVCVDISEHGWVGAKPLDPVPADASAGE